MEKEREIVIDIQTIISDLNRQLILAAKNGIEVRFEEMNVTQIEDRVSRNQMSVKLFKAL